ncbi:pectinesterase 2-like [Tasmannia lanceolata]|uniref:pectinesterase 2-like n=1 Tax=Tasmannia lanceolata TaxID=3420 RepID=UPI004062B42F
MLPISIGKRHIIYIKAGTYKEKVFVGKDKINVTFIGDGIDKTIISNNLSNKTGYSTYNSSTVGIAGEWFMARDITFENTAGPANGQAVALMFEANHSVFYKCSFKGYQDTLYVKGGYQFYRECDIYGTIDFIFGGAAVVFQRCNINVRTPLHGWLEWNVSTDKIFYAEYGNCGLGAKKNNRVQWRGLRVINKSEAAQFTVETFIHGGDWLPQTHVPYDSRLMAVLPNCTAFSLVK